MFHLLVFAGLPCGSDEPGVGATRCCSHASVGPIKAGVVKERLSKFDGASMVFEYEAVEGVPSFVSYAVNRWSVEQAGDRSAIVRIHATLVLRGPARLFSWLVKWQMQAAGARVGEELKHFSEHGRHHPRKQATLEATARQAF